MLRINNKVCHLLALYVSLFLTHNDRLIESDPFNHDGRLLSVHISVQVELGLKNQLFYMAHKLVDESPGMDVYYDNTRHNADF